MVNGVQRTGLSIVLVLLGLSAISCSRTQAPTAQSKPQPASASGSSQCKSCHPAFYKKWATSHHGLAMQPFTSAFGNSALAPMGQSIKIGDAAYRAVLTENPAFVEETGPNGSRKLAIDHVMGGKNTYYFLTPMERGRLQVLPLGYDLGTKAWYDVAASGVRMHIEGPGEQPLHWTDSAFTFNTSCYSCHVSQLNTNYDAASDTYRSTWREPGINCETCHDDGTAHVALYSKDLQAKHKDMRILRTTELTVQQRNEMCAPCHAKMSPISSSYRVTQRFFDHYDLVTLEDSDYYPDGRDLGENYTYTGWLMNPCIRNGKFDCIHCHTSSGRYRFATENPSGACLPCHQEKASNLEAHAHHKAGTPGGNCIDCHMPKTRFANMNRSDHSFLPPTPAVTLKLKSPNACNLCHKDKSAAWADAKVRQWHKQDYQKPVLERALLVDAGRKQEWERLPAILAYIQNPARDAVIQASLIRILVRCPDPRKIPVILNALQHASPLIRAAAASSLGGSVSPETRDALVKATSDEYRLVRIRAAAALAAVPVNALPAPQQEAVKKATDELIGSYTARSDDFASRTNLGNFYMERGELDQSIQAFEAAIRLRPDSVGTLVNASLAYSRAGRNSDAERVLDQALRTAPDNAAAHFNRGLLLAEMGRKKEAEESLRKALTADAHLAPAAYNLCILEMERKDFAGISHCRQAVTAAPQNEKYVFTLGFYLDQTQQSAEALSLVEAFSRKYGGGLDTQLLLAELYAKGGKPAKALSVYQAVSKIPGLPSNQLRFVESKVRGLQTR